MLPLLVVRTCLLPRCPIPDEVFPGDLPVQSLPRVAVFPRGWHARRVGRVLVRKLVLRGYNVRVLVRNKAQVLGILPSSVGIIEGDVGSPEAFRAAVEGIDKAS